MSEMRAVIDRPYRHYFGAASCLIGQLVNAGGILKRQIGENLCGPDPLRPA